MMGVRWAVLCALAGCYQPTIPAGAACTVDADCLGMPCVDNVCGGTSNPPPPESDAPTVTPDARDPDAPPPPPVTMLLGDDDGELIDTEISEAEPTTPLDGIDHTSVDSSEFSLLRWNLANVPKGTVTAAKLTVKTFDMAADDGGTIHVHRLRQSWVENQATWEKRNANATWTTPGALFPSSDQDPIVDLNPGAINTSYTVDLPLDMVQAWLDTVADNNGILIMRGTTNKHVHLRDRENGPGGQLEITVQPD